MKGLNRIFVGVLFVLALADTEFRCLEILQSWRSLEDPVTQADVVFESTRTRLEKMGLTRLGYRTEPGSIWLEKSWEFFVVQYALAPVILRPHITDDNWVLMNYAATGRPFPAPDLIPVEDFGHGLALYRKPVEFGGAGIPQLGRVWHEVEGEWIGTWKRRGEGATFDAKWKGPNGFIISDRIVFESLTGNDIVLYRRDTRSRYRGRLSDDGTRIENGQSDFQGAPFSWSATIEKE